MENRYRHSLINFVFWHNNIEVMTCPARKWGDENAYFILFLFHLDFDFLGKNIKLEATSLLDFGSHVTMRSSTISRSVESSVWKFSKLETDIKVEEPGWQLWGWSSSNKVCWKPGHLDIFLWLAVVACPASAIPLSGCQPCPPSPDFPNSEFSISKYLWNISLNFFKIFLLFLPALPQPPNQLFWTKYLSCPLGARKIKPAAPCWYFVKQKVLILVYKYN